MHLMNTNSPQIAVISRNPLISLLARLKTEYSRNERSGQLQARLISESYLKRMPLLATITILIERTRC